MNLLVIGDLHGQPPGIFFSDADMVVSPGDFCSDAVREHAFRAMAMNDRHPDRPVEWYDLLGRKAAKDLVESSLADGRRVLEALNDLGLPVIVVPGNGDWRGDPHADWTFLRKNHFRDLTDGLHRIVNADQKCVTLEGLSVVGYGSASAPELPQTPEEWAPYSSVQRAYLTAAFEALLSRVAGGFENSASPVAFLTHNVPYGTPLDVITDSASPRYGLHFGSVIARRIVGERRPAVCIGGHMHEHFGMCTVKGVPVVNGGFGNRVNTLIEIDAGGVRRIRFHGGEPAIYPTGSGDPPSPAR